MTKGIFFNYLRSKVDLPLQVGAVQEEWRLEGVRRLRRARDGSVARAIAPERPEAREKSRGETERETVRAGRQPAASGRE